MGKRVLDLSLALGGLVVFFPFLVLFGLWIKIDSPGPIFFRQERVGRGGVPFQIFKLRTMQLNSEKTSRLTIGHDSRVTRAGRFLRRHKLDEFPQLLNVVIGNMSLVGPRPEVKEYFELYPADAKRAMISLRPGIAAPTSLVLFDESDILGRSANPHHTYISEIIPIKARCALQYEANNSLLDDIKVVLRTLRKVGQSFVT
jgi:lipopolysaccharide/colanic/teichoic acid biosynthesis glycosyltransferase